jgi:hypothetical protein
MWGEGREGWEEDVAEGAAGGKEEAGHRPKPGRKAAVGASVTGGVVL